MKKKLTVNTLALGNLKQRRKQYTIMIIGIILAMVFSSSGIFFMQSAKDTGEYNRARAMGWQDCIVSVDGFEQNDYENLVSEGVLDECGIAHILGYAYDTKENYNNGAAVGWLDDKATELSFQELAEGIMPTNENEVAIEKSKLLVLGYRDAKIGDTIKLRFKVRNGNDHLKPVTKKFKLTGILEDKYQELTYGGQTKEFKYLIPSIFVAQNTSVDLGGKEDYSAYVKINKQFVKDFKNGREDSRYVGDFEALSDNLRDNNLEYEMNTTAYYNARSFLDFEQISSKGAYVFVIVLVLIFASCVIISNAFNMNLKDRKKQIGMLRAVGTTKRQIINIFGREAFIISLVATPISIAISYGVVRILLRLMSDTAIIKNSIWLLLVCAIFNIIVVMLSALFPLIRASKITPIQAIRNISNNRKVKTKKVKSKKEFTPSKHLAKRNLMFYKGSKFAVIFMLVITIVGTSLGASYISYAKSNIEELYYDYELVQPNETSLTDNDKFSIEALPYVSSVYGAKSRYIQIAIDKYDAYFATIDADSFCCAIDGKFDVNKLKEDIANLNLNDWQIEDIEYFKNSTGVNKIPINADLYGYDQRQIATLENSLIEGKIDYEKLATGEEIILVAPQSVKYCAKNNIGGGMAGITLHDDEHHPNERTFELVSEGERTVNVGDELSVVIDDEVKTVKVGAIVSPNAVGSENGFGIYSIAFLTTLQGYSGFAPADSYYKLGINVNCELNDEKDEQICEDLKLYQNRSGAWLDNNYQYTKKQLDSASAFITTMLAISILCFAICTSIINNSVSAQIRENKRVIGTLRAVGADEKELVKSYFNQMIYTLGKGVAIGFGLFVGLFFIIKIVCNIFYMNFSFTFNPWIALVMTIALVIACTLNLWLKVRKEMKNSIVENIREL